MTLTVSVDLETINRDIGDAEATADRAFFDQLLAPAFSMVRPDGVRFDDRAAFLESLTVSSPRTTRIESTTLFENRAIVICAVAKDGDVGRMQHRNIRIFTRSTPQAAWQLVSWVTEPLMLLSSTPSDS